MGTKPSIQLPARLKCRWVLGLVELSVDDPAAALRWLDPVADMLQNAGIGEPDYYYYYYSTPI